MRPDIHSRQEIIKANYNACQGACKKERGELPGRPAAVSGMNRDCLAWVLGRYGKNGAEDTTRSRTGRKQPPEGKRGGRPPKYKIVPFVKVLSGIRDFYDYPCGKLLAPLTRGTTGYLAGSAGVRKLISG